MAQPYSRTSQPVAGNANTVPSEIALMMSAVARERRSGGTQREIMFMEAGNTAASPSPSAMRAAISAPSDIIAAGGVSAVHADHQSTATPSTSQPP